MALDLRPGALPTLPSANAAPAHPAGIEVRPDPGAGGTRTLPHRPALDGLRGIAVAAVVVYHLEPRLLPGGFLGVSLFFTLSGFLITNLLLAEWRRRGRIDLRAFWARRFRRLLPAALLTLLLVLAVCAGSNDPHLLSNLRGDVLGALAYVANWRFVLNGDPYGAGFQEPSPVLHFWSLAIEEQFYVVVAIVAFVLARHARRARAWALTFGAAALGSMLATWWLSRSGDTARVYFGSDTRAFELLAGVLLAIGAGFAVPSFLRGRWWRHALGPAALAALAGTMVLGGVEQRWLYRGGFWVVAALSVALIVAALDDGPLARLLAWRPLAALGLISYGVYLFHWPLFAWLTPARVGVDGWALAGIRVGATLTIAVGSYLLVEQPIRRGRLPAARHRPLIAGVLVATVAVLLAGTTLLDGAAGRRAVATSKPGLQLNTSLAAGEQADGGPAGRTLDGSAEPPPPLERVLILGDSLLHQSYPSIRDRLASLGIDSLAVGGPGQHLMKNDGAWQAELDRAIDAYDPDLVVLESCCGWGSPWQRELYHAPDGRVIEPDTPESWAEWDRLARVLTARARQGGRPVAWVLAPPAQTNGYYGPIEARIDVANDLYRRIARCDPGVGLIDWRVMSGPDGRFVWDLPAADGSLVRIRTEDGLHLTPAGQAAVADLTRDGVSGLWQRTRGRIPPAASPPCS